MNSSLAEQHFQAGLSAMERKDYETAESEFRSVVQLDPRNAKALVELGKIVFAFTGTFEEAEELFEKALRVDSSIASAEGWLASIAARQGRSEDAEVHFERAISLACIANDMVELGIAYSSYGDFLGRVPGRFADAERAFQSALGVQPKMTMAMRDYARLLASVERHDEAESWFQTAYKLNPDSKFNNHRYGEFLMRRKGREAEAEAFLRRAIEIDPANEDAQHDLLWVRQKRAKSNNKQG